MTDSAAADGTEPVPSPVVMRKTAFVLAVGVGLLWLLVTLVFGATYASLMVAAFGVFYSALAFLNNTNREDKNFQASFVDALNSKFSLFVILLVYGACALTLAIYLARATFIVSAVDEFGKPVAADDLRVQSVWIYRKEKTGEGEWEVGYFAWSPLGDLPVTLVRGDVERTETLTRTGFAPYRDLRIALLSGHPLIRTTHVTLRGQAIGMVLDGNLPPVLDQRFGDVAIVLNNEVYANARKLIDFYPTAENYHTYTARVRYPGGASAPQLADYAMPASVSEPYGEYEEGTAELNEERAREWLKARDVATQVTWVTSDFSSEMLGCRLVEPLPESFHVRLRGPDDFYEGAYVRPLGPARTWIEARGGAPYPEPGVYSVSVQASPDIAAAQRLMREGTTDDSSLNRRMVSKLLDYLQRMKAPAGVVGVSILPWPVSTCGQVASTFAEIAVPPPSLRVTFLENTSDRPVTISSLAQTVLPHDGFAAFDAAADTVDVSEWTDDQSFELQPGQMIVVPTELRMKGIFAQPEARGTAADGKQFDVVFELADLDTDPRIGYLREEGPIDRDLLPRRFSIPSSQIVFPGPGEGDGASDYYEGWGTLDASRGKEFTIGPRVTELALRINSLAYTPRRDSRMDIAMLGNAYGIGSCPFVFVRNPSSPRYINFGHIIENHEGRSASAADRVAIGRDFEAIELRELEPETSYIDSARLIVARGGRDIAFRPANPLLRQADGAYAVLDRGERLALEFDYEAQEGDGAARLEVTGYYEPYYRDPRRPAR